MPIVHRNRRAAVQPTWCKYAHSKAEAANPNLWDTLVGAWQMTLGRTGSRLFDVSGQGNHGELTNMDPATDWVSSRFGPVLNYTPATEHVLVPGDPDTTNSFSVFMRFRRDLLSGNRRMITNDAAPANGFLCDMRSNHVLRFRIDEVGASNINMDSATTLNDQLWHTALLVADKASTAHFYIDGKLDANSASLAGFGDTSGSLGELRIGGDGGSGFAGDIAAVGLWGSALNASQAKHLHYDLDALTSLRKRTQVSVPAAPGGLSIPVAMHHYTKNITAV